MNLTINLGNSFFQLVNTSAVVLGWIAFHHLAKKRELEKEIREFAKTTKILTEEIISSAKTYHLAPTHDQSTCDDLKWEIQKLSRMCKKLRRKNNSLTPEHVYEFRSAITSENFQTASFTQQLTNSSIIISIEQTGLKLMSELELIHLN